MILGVSFDTVAENKAFAEKFGFPYKLLSATAAAMGLAYGAADAKDQGNARRISYLIGPDGRVKKVWTKVDVRAFADEAFAAL